MLTNQLSYITIKNISTKPKYCDANNDDGRTEQRVLFCYLSGELEPIKDKITQVQRPGKLTCKDGDSEQKDDHAAWSRNSTDDRCTQDKEEADKENYQTTKSVGHLFPATFYALHTH